MGKILVVDDSETMRMIVKKGVKKALQAGGKPEAEFVEAADGQQALEALSKHDDIVLVLCDMNMPNVSGMEFVRTVRSENTTTHVDVGHGKSIIKRTKNALPIIMVTTETALDVVKGVLDAGANDYIKKPFTPQQFVDKLAPYLG